MNCIVIDDEPVARMGMEDLITNSPPLVLLKSFRSAIGVDEFLKNHQVDIVFLDIEMPDLNGIEFAESVPGNVLVIFTTAYSQYAIDSYNLDALDYLVKPISQKRFDISISKASSYLSLMKKEKYIVENAMEDYIIVRADKRFHKIYFDDIIYIEALKDYVIINIIKDDRHITWMNLKNIYSKLPSNKFSRINRSYIVNNKYVTSFNNFSVWIDDLEINLGKNYREDFFRNYNF
ncbi:two-component system, LytT family, response regulator [Paenimyroides ummariense]|uniref:Two-component system, LytT family, response regulator n=1 Tax=Paenimyroides ummariense TaxID=913024 RepID=A0A1I5CST2_9FLAO|nr:LytTR family DNA-binding domain-containing protein [Paenimyroides ummariense]SFN89906.1 two-component system, LytT family, response regulator [Paenimyroides ummariense]